MLLLPPVSCHTPVPVEAMDCSSTSCCCRFCCSCLRCSLLLTNLQTAVATLTGRDLSVALCHPQLVPPAPMSFLTNNRHAGCALLAAAAAACLCRWRGQLLCVKQPTQAQLRQPRVLPPLACKCSRRNSSSVTPFPQQAVDVIAGRPPWVQTAAAPGCSSWCHEATLMIKRQHWMLSAVRT